MNEKLKTRIEEVCRFVLESKQRGIDGAAADLADDLADTRTHRLTASLAERAARIHGDAQWIAGYEEAVKNVLAILSEEK